MTTQPQATVAHPLQANINAALVQFEQLRALQAELDEAVNLIASALRNGHKLLICGNGGSAADASHLATEFVVRYRQDRIPLPAICLCDSGSTLTAIGNDYEYHEVFARQVRAFGQVGDVLITLSTSGQSPNVLAAMEAANCLGLTSIAFLGRDGGRTRGVATLELIVPGTDTARIQEAQKLLYHTLCEMTEQRVLAD